MLHLKIQVVGFLGRLFWKVGGRFQDIGYDLWGMEDRLRMKWIESMGS